MAARGKPADLIVLARPGKPDGEAALHAAIFETGRLLLLVPSASSASPVFGLHMAIAWKVSEQASRAVTAAIPWLKQAAQVSVLTVGTPTTSAPDDALALLKDHGIEAESVLVEHGAESAGAELLRQAHAIGADCLVMGAYRHNRLLETILGGVTHHMLKGADLPLFMMH